MHNYSKLSLLAVVAIISVGTAAYAANSGVGNDAMTILSAKTSLVKAVTAAEQHVSGKATQAEYEHSKLGWIYEVEVVSGSKVFDVKVDADKGTIISSAEDKADSDDDHDD